MVQKTWWDFYDECPFEHIGRFCKDDFGQDIIIHMPRISWTYIDWLRDMEGFDPEAFVLENINAYLPEYGCMHDFINGAVRKGFLTREQNGLPRPEWVVPAEPYELQELLDIEE
jgi:hypothetical protein